MRALFQVIAGLLAIGAGVYLLQYSGQTIDVGGQSGRSWFDIIDHGIGIYFLGRGLWMLTQAGELADLNRGMSRLVELREWEAGQAVDGNTDTSNTGEATS